MSYTVSAAVATAVSASLSTPVCPVQLTVAVMSTRQFSLGLPNELFTPIFAISRIAGWSAHRLEELINANKIIRPAYKAVGAETPYVKLAERY